MTFSRTKTINYRKVLTLANWLTMHEEEIRRDPYIRDKNAIVAYRLLPVV